MPQTPRRWLWLKILVAVLALPMAVGGVVFWIYGTDTHHADRSSIWWEERGRNLIPPAATDITLRQDFLDHYAIYTISEKDLTTFLDKHFGVADSFSERSPLDTAKIGTTIGPLGWVATKGSVVYEYAAANGGMHRYYHDPATGLTYQKSAYW